MPDLGSGGAVHGVSRKGLKNCGPGGGPGGGPGSGGKMVPSSAVSMEPGPVPRGVSLLPQIPQMGSAHLPAGDRECPVSTCKLAFLGLEMWPGVHEALAVLSRAYNPNTWEREEGRSRRVTSSRSSLAMSLITAWAT